MQTTPGRPRACSLTLLALAALAGCASTPSFDTTEYSYSAGRAPAQPAPAPVIARTPVAAIEVRTAPVSDPLGIVYFDFDRSEVKQDYRDMLARHAQALRARSGVRAVIEGHTDTHGSAEYNLALGQQRAEAVRRALVELGAPEEQLEAVSFGETEPASSGTDARSHALNRRAEIRPATGR